MNPGLLLIGALAPVMIGPYQQVPGQSRTLEAQLCNGGTISILLDDSDEEQAPPCPEQACHAGNCRKRI
ncbi:hypothetical protein [Parerythrobacter jejuensis]|uniref:hypothetical protein n=1 Tax=Parerythrobacter jejuensis TaxID=795812 RepID=UPI0031D31746